MATTPSPPPPTSSSSPPPLPTSSGNDAQTPAPLDEEVEEEEEEADASGRVAAAVVAAENPLTMAASVVLTHLPRDASEALRGAGELGLEKVTVRLQPVGSAPMLRQRVFKVSATQRFETVVRFLRRKLGLNDAESVFCYINNVFAPAPDEVVGNLWRCFKAGDELVVNYSITPAFG